ncbi:MAG: AI-2E family transporter, partial [Candidatus Obscuribacterales bacterium]|nr:AI-2E family transporter [Steroidobacteraceae bacterium]
MLPDLSSNTQWLRPVLVAGMLLGILLLTFTVLQPFLVPLIWGGILAYVSWPLNQRLFLMFRARIGWAALCTTLIVTVVLIVPLIWLVLVLRIEAVHGYTQVQAFLASKPTLSPALRDLPWLGPWLQTTLEQLSADPAALQQQLVLLAEQSSPEVTRLLGTVGRNAAKLFFAVLSMFFLLRDGPRLFSEARAILEDAFGPRARDYLEAVGTTTQAVVYAIILGAIAQGVVAGIGYWIFGIKAPVLMGAVTALIALIPFGAPLVWVSLSIWLLLIGNV